MYEFINIELPSTVPVFFDCDGDEEGSNTRHINHPELQQ